MEKFTVIEACLTHRVSPTNLKDLLRLRLRLIGVSSCRVTTQKKNASFILKKSEDFQFTKENHRSDEDVILKSKM